MTPHLPPAVHVFGARRSNRSSPDRLEEKVSKLTTTKSRINGIDLEAHKKLVEAPRADSGKGCTGFKVTTQWMGQTRSESTVESFTCGGPAVRRPFTITADEPTDWLGSGSAPNPQELLLSAVNACLIVGYVAQASIREIMLRDCRIETEGELDLRGFLGLDENVPPGCRRINYIVYLDGDGTSEQYEEIHQAVMATSPNYFNMAQPVQMCGRLA